MISRRQWDGKIRFLRQPVLTQCESTRASAVGLAAAPDIRSLQEEAIGEKV